MNFAVSESIDRNILATLESTSTAVSLDDLLETSLSDLLGVDHVKAAEIQLFNRQNKLITVATARNRGSNDQMKTEVRAQSWLLDSTVEHTRRRTKSAIVSPVRLKTARALPTHLKKSLGLVRERLHRTEDFHWKW